MSQVLVMALSRSCFLQRTAAFTPSSSMIFRRSRLPGQEAAMRTIWKARYGHGSAKQQFPSLIQRRSSLSDTDKNEVEALITEKGNQIRSLKEAGTSKEDLAPHVAELLALKSKLDPEAGKKSAKKANNNKSRKKNKGQKQPAPSSDAEQSEAITPRAEDYSKWYSDIIRAASIAEQSAVRGCMVIKPWGMSIWDSIRVELDGKIKAQGAENCYFPLLIPKSFLSKEAEHVDGFAKECAVVTHHRLTAAPDGGGLIADPEAELEEPLIIRPTSETVIWSTFKKWIVSHRDLPLKVNQWANVMRWEMRTRPFLRTSEFLWQEGHTAHATSDGALADAETMLHEYASLAEEFLAIPVVRGVKSPAERFAGAEETFTIEALMQNGWALQSGTSHFLGQSFGKAFDVKFQDAEGAQREVWGTSWGVSTRLVGALIMTHSDDNGLVLPPKVAPLQVVIVPIQPKKNDLESKAALDKALDNLVVSLKAVGLRVKVDDRDYIRNGAKYYEWERKGVPLRIELGPRDIKNGVCVFKYRTGPAAEKQSVSLDESAAAAVSGLENFQVHLLEAARDRLAAGVDCKDSTYENMRVMLEGDEASGYPGAGLFLVPWKCDAANEERIKEECKATIRCYPLDSNGPGAVNGKKCFYSGEDATHMALFGRAF
eukprot:CAMPEP_0113303654 /NCGR_PEP_ID=MMETSP0010_2-20120614/3982_1 /TAXON_ID=216773 ORGANISM="Corethron hystrix, Strain 308" /NCGR_SAMPLE_ID=MMETSP0010_2 /ASSEMBLY_ACC=CAM_ASM_000155 /LENGTH=656 /DNA_ID=CAMNT_0000157691 /DNA_START=173 /DNA_END=2143 /DNA_ORIENTATION=+ /assembly_acc=CAM_ASM_000155